MTPTLISLLILFFGVFIFIVIMLLPTIIELKKPKDAGPRILENYNAQFTINLVMNMENDNIVFDPAIVKKVAEIIAILPSLEP